MKKSGIILIFVILFGFIGFRINEFFQSYYFTFPIELINSYQIPCTSIEIEENQYLVEIDLGSKVALSLHKSVLDKIKKVPCGISRRMDFRGNVYKTPLYLISNTKLGSFYQSNIKVREESSSFTNEGSIVNKASEATNKDGRLGRDFFSGKNLFMDFARPIFIACSQLKNIEKEGYITKNLQPVPFKYTKDGIIFEIETDLGLKKFVLDTGTSGTITRNATKTHPHLKNDLSLFESAKFSINGNDFGPRKIYCIDISPQLSEIDGFLGMDFLKDHIVYLDFRKDIAYIGKIQNKTPPIKNS